MFPTLFLKLNFESLKKISLLFAQGIEEDENKENNPNTGAVAQASLSRLQGDVAARDSEISSLKAELDRVRSLLQQVCPHLEILE